MLQRFLFLFYFNVSDGNFTVQSLVVLVLKLNLSKLKIANVTKLYKFQALKSNQLESRRWRSVFKMDIYIQGGQGRNVSHVEIFIVIDCIEIFVALFLKTKSVCTRLLDFSRFLSLSLSHIFFLFYRITIFIFLSSHTYTLSHHSFLLSTNQHANRFGSKSDIYHVHILFFSFFFFFFFCFSSYIYQRRHITKFDIDYNNKQHSY